MDQLTFVASRRHRWVSALAALGLGTLALVVVAVPGRLTEDRVGMVVFVSAGSMVYLCAFLDATTRRTILDADGIHTRSYLVVKRSGPWDDVREICVQTYPNVTQYGGVTGHTTRIRCTLANGKGFTVVTASMARADDMPAIGQQITDYWHAHCASSSWRAGVDASTEAPSPPVALRAESSTPARPTDTGPAPEFQRDELAVPAPARPAARSTTTHRARTAGRLTGVIAFLLLPWWSLGFATFLAFVLAALLFRSRGRAFAVVLWSSAVLYAIAATVVVATSGAVPGSTDEHVFDACLIITMPVGGLQALVTTIVAAARGGLIATPPGARACSTSYR